MLVLLNITTLLTSRQWERIPKTVDDVPRGECRSEVSEHLGPRSRILVDLGSFSYQVKGIKCRRTGRPPHLHVRSQ